MRTIYRPFYHYRVISIITFVLLLGAFILLLLVAISLPILKPVYLLSVVSTVEGQPPTSSATTLRFGVWGFCASSTLEQPDWFGSGFCYGPKLGYDIPPEITSLAGVPSQIVDAVEKALKLILVLHPIAGGLALIDFILACFLGPHFMAIITLIIAITTGLLTAVVFAIDLVLVFVTRNVITDVAHFHFRVDISDGTWMILAALIATWLSVGLLSARACYCCGVSPDEPEFEDYEVTKRELVSSDATHPP